MFILHLKGLYSSSMPTNKGKVPYPAPQQGEKNIEVDCYEIKTLCLILGGEKRIMCMVATIALSLSKGNKEFKEKSKEEFKKKFFFF